MAPQSWRFLRPSSLVALAAWTLALIWSHLAGLAARQRWRAAGRPPGRPPSVSLAAGHRLTCVVTGASSGLGWALSRALFAAGHHVVLACPDPARGAAALQALRAVPEPSEPWVGGGSAAFEPLDLRDPDSVREFCSRLPGLIPRGGASSLVLRGQPPPGRPPLGLLVLNAACMPASEAWCPAAGASADFAANCLGHALLVELLLARARPEQSVRRDALVLNVTSFTHRCVRRSETGQLRRALRGGRLAGFAPPQAYHVSKWAALVLQGELHRRRAALGLQDYQLLHVDPGAVDSALVRHWPAALRGAFPALLRPLRLAASPVRAAARVLEASSADVGGEGGEGAAQAGGRYVFAPQGGRAALRPAALARCPRERERLWQACRALRAWGPGHPARAGAPLQVAEKENRSPVQ